MRSDFSCIVIRDALIFTLLSYTKFFYWKLFMTDLAQLCFSPCDRIYVTEYDYC